MVVTNETKIYQYGKLTFILYKKSIIIKTSLNQTFNLLSNGYWSNRFTNNRLNLIKNMIELGEIRDFNELASYTRPGIKWTGTCINYDISNCYIKVLK